MNCQDFETRLPPYVDGELGVDETLATETHAAECPRCQALVERERHFRQLLRRQPREAAPPELHPHADAGACGGVSSVPPRVALNWL